MSDTTVGTPAPVDQDTPFSLAAARVAAGADPHEEARALVAAMTTEERHGCLDGDHPFWAAIGEMGKGGYHRRTFPAAEVARLGIDGFRFSDGPRGVVIGPATAFPVSMARGATWDLDLEERIGEVIGTELRAVGATLYGGVCVNVLRHPAWGRAQETYGEDPFHVGEMGAALTRGVQRHAMACVKHFACNSMENARFTVDVVVDEAALHEVYLPHFRRIIDEGVACVMSAYNAVNGEWCGQSRELLSDVLRDEWGFDGFVISDWIFGLRDTGRSVRAGLDVEMPYRMVRAFGLAAALEAGDCDEGEISQAVERVVATLLRFHRVLSQPRPSLDVLACEPHRALAREAAEKAMVLLRNEPAPEAPLLPLERSALTKVAMLGVLATHRNLGDGGSSDVWAPSVVTPFEGMRAALAGAEVVHLTEPADAADADVAVVVVGYTKADEGEFIGETGSAELAALMPPPDEPEWVARYEAQLAAETTHFEAPEDPFGGKGFATGGDRTSLRLRPQDEALIAETVAANPRTVVVLVAGSAVDVSGWDRTVPAIVQAWYSGMEGGHALASLLLGDVVPSGRLPFTVATDASHLPPFDRDATVAVYDGWHGYWKLAAEGNEPAYPFGFGLSYTELAIEAASAERAGDEVVVQAQVANLGARSGVEVVQVYGAAGDGPRRLVGFTRVPLEPGARTAVQVVVATSTMARRGSGRWLPVEGPITLAVARDAADPAAIELRLA
jgi:beta-glucosidase